MPPELWPIHIASRGRPRGATFRLFWLAGIPYTLWLEPQDAEEYSRALAGGGREVEALATVRVLPESGRGLPYVRAAIHEEATWESRWFWMMDDDVVSIFRTGAERNLAQPWHEARPALLHAQEIAESVNGAAQVALEYAQFAFRGPKRRAITNGYCDVVVGIHSARTRHLRFRPEFDLKVDRDFTLQAIAAGWCTVRTQEVAFVAPKNGSNAGGCAEQYGEDGREERGVDELLRAWGPYCTKVVKPDGRVDARIAWRKLGQGSLA